MYDQLDFGLTVTPSTRTPTPRTRGRRSAVARPPQLALDLAEPVAEREPPPVEPTIKGQVRVEGVVREVLGPKAMVTLTSNRSTMISCRRRKGVTYVRIHAIFAQAPREVLVAAAKYVAGERTSAADNNRIDAWIEAHRHQVKRPTRGIAMLPHGEVHDLQAMFDRLNARYFDDRIQARITWGRALTNQKRHTIRLGSYCDEQRLIRIHPALDQAFVPEYFVESVVFHEMLHEVHGAPEHPSGRREVHTPAFNEDEKKFHAYERARRWEHKHLSRLLKY